MEGYDELRNFLFHHDLGQYFQGFANMGVTKMVYLKDVDDTDLEKLGLSRPERTRLKKKLEAHFSTFGKLKKILLRKRYERANYPEPAAADLRPPPPSPPPVVAPAVPVAKEPAPPEQTAAVLIRPDSIELKEVLGEGAHGSVHKGIYHWNQELIPVAVKTIFNHRKGPSVETMFLKEAESMMRLHHPHIIKLHGIVLGSPLMLVQELAPLGNLEGFLQTCRHKVNLERMLRYACQLADAMTYLEEIKIVHRDLATRNILLVAEDKLKLSDFGLARVLTKGSVYNLTNAQTLLPIGWTSIEALNSGKFSSASDVWSYAVTLWEIFTLGEVPWEGMGPLQVCDQLERGNRLHKPKLCPHDMYEIMLCCWAAEPDERPKFSELYDRLKMFPVHIAQVVQPHAMDTGIELVENEILYVIDQDEDLTLFVMTKEGLAGHVVRDYVELKPNPQEGMSFLAYNKNPPIRPRPAEHYRSQKRKEEKSSPSRTPVAAGSGGKNPDNTYMTIVTHNKIIRKDENGEHNNPFPAPDPYEVEPQPYLAPSTPGDFMDLTSPPHSSPRHPLQPNDSYFDSPRSSHPVPSPRTRRPSSDQKPPFSDPYVEMHPSALGSPVHVNTPIDVSALPPPIIDSSEALHAALYKRADSCLGERVPDAVTNDDYVPRRTPNHIPRPSLSEQPLSSHYCLARGSDGSAEPQTRTPYLVSEVTSELAEQVAKLKLDPEFIDTDHHLCEKALEKHPSDVDKAKQEIKIELLLGMSLPYINRQDCERALGHCRWNVERAGLWLMEQSVDIAKRP